MGTERGERIDRRAGLIERITLDEAARRSLRTRKTLYKWIQSGLIGFPEGLHKIRGRWVIDWPVFEERVLRPRKFDGQSSRRRAA